jgi:hypothetical protein
MQFQRSCLFNKRPCALLNISIIICFHDIGFLPKIDKIVYYQNYKDLLYICYFERRYNDLRLISLQYKCTRENSAQAHTQYFSKYLKILKYRFYDKFKFSIITIAPFFGIENRFWFFIGGVYSCIGFFVISF